MHAGHDPEEHERDADAGAKPFDPFGDQDGDGALVPVGPAEALSEVEDDGLARRREELARRIAEKPHPTAMLSRFGWLLRFISRILFAHVLFERRCIDNIRDASSRGSVVYVMQSRSLLDYLYFNWAFQEHGLPIARFSNGLKTAFLRGPFGWLTGLFRRGPSEKVEEQMQALVTHDESVFLFLEKPGANEHENQEYSQKFLYRLIRAQRHHEGPVYVIPLLLIWERRPERKHASLIEEFFGSVQSPGFFRKGIYWFQTAWQSFLKFGQPVAQVSTGIDLRQFSKEYPDADTADASELLRERLLEDIERERRVILGPTGQPPRTIWRELSQQPELIEAVREVAAEEQVDEDAILQRAKAQYEEIAAQPSLLIFKVLSAILSLVWYRIYDGFEVDEEGLDAVREAARESSIVLIPSHKSHVDYLIISYIFYHYGLNPPVIAAGVNLSFWPLGWLFRRSGAFFIRRSFRGESLYPVVFREYLIKMMEEGYPVEFFIEGTRSRTGKLIKPKYGMLDMILRAYASGRLESVKLVPISVAYEKIIEEGTYREELLGAEKEKESLGGLLRTPKFLASKFGRLYIEFDEPISVGEYFDKFGVDRLDPQADDLDALTVRMAHRIIYDINRVTPVTPTALAAMVLLNNEARGIDRKRLLREVGFLLNFLTQPSRQVRLSRSLRDALAAKRAAISRLEVEREVERESKRENTRPKPAEEEADSSGEGLVRLVGEGESADMETVMGDAVAELMDRALENFVDGKLVDARAHDDETIYSVPEEQRVQLSMYRNMIVHHFVPEALLATAIRRFRTHEVPLDELMAETLFLSRLFKYEWIYEERAEFENVFRRTLSYFEHSGWAHVVKDEEQGDVVHVDDPPPAELEFFRRQVLTFLEAYAIVAAMLPHLSERAWEKGELLKAALKFARDDYLRGRLIFHESLSKPTYDNALRLLSDWGVVERRFDESKKKETYRLAEDWRDGEKLDELQAHLEAFVYEGRRR